MTNSSKPLSFPQAISKTQSLIDQISSNELDEAEIQQRITSLFSTKNGGRGFFVAYLTSDIPLADNPSLGVIEGLKSATDICSDLLVKNLAMSSAMVITHKQNNNLEGALGSQRVCQRTSNLIQQLDIKLIREKLGKLRTTIECGYGEYQEFLEHWGYDEQQKQAIQEAIFRLS